VNGLLTGLTSRLTEMKPSYINGEYLDNSEMDEIEFGIHIMNEDTSGPR